MGRHASIASRTSGVAALSARDVAVIIAALNSAAEYELAQTIADSVQTEYGATLVEDVPEDGVYVWPSLPTIPEYDAINMAHHIRRLA